MDNYGGVSVVVVVVVVVEVVVVVVVVVVEVEEEEEEEEEEEIKVEGLLKYRFERGVVFLEFSIKTLSVTAFQQN